MQPIEKAKMTTPPLTNVMVKVADHKVTLTGTVHSWPEKEEAERMAWKTPGIWTLENELVVEYVTIKK